MNAPMTHDVANAAKIEKAAAIAGYAADLSDSIDVIVREAIEYVTDDQWCRNRAGQLLFAAKALSAQVGWLCDLTAETLEQEGRITKGGPREWMLPPNCRD